jgi:hypothetical protein
MGEPQWLQNTRWLPSAVQKSFSASAPAVTTKSVVATSTLEAKAEPPALRQREQWQKNPAPSSPRIS